MATAFITTDGHRDTLEIAGESRFDLYDLNIDKPEPLVPRHLRFTIRERMDATGQVLVPLHEDDVAAASAARLRPHRSISKLKLPAIRPVLSTPRGMN